MIFRKWGFHSYLRDLFGAPDGVMRYLCAQYKVHQIPVGDKTTKMNEEKVIQNSGLTTFFTENHKVSSDVLHIPSPR